MKDYLTLALQADVRKRALKVALVVGTVLALINHYDALLSGALQTTNFVKIALTYFVPYAVSTHSSVAALRSAKV